MRTTKAVVEENVLEGRDAGPRLTARMVHHAAQATCACMVGADGLTPFRRLSGRKFGTPLAGLGERVWLREVHGGEVAWILPQVIPPHRGRFRREVSHGPNDRANAGGRWKVVSQKDPFSAGDLESTSAEFTCSRGTPGEINPAAQRLERHPVDALPPRS